MNIGRLPVEFRDRTKQFAAGAIRLFVKFAFSPNSCFVPGLPLPRMFVKPRERDPMKNLFPNSEAHFRKPMNLKCGWNCSAKNAASSQRKRSQWKKKLANSWR